MATYHDLNQPSRLSTNVKDFNIKDLQIENENNSVLIEKKISK